jgi:hypothetical protein
MPLVTKQPEALAVAGDSAGDRLAMSAQNAAAAATTMADLNHDTFTSGLD